MAKLVEIVKKNNSKLNNPLERVSGQPFLWEYEYNVVDSDKLDYLKMIIQEEDEFFPLSITLKVHTIVPAQESKTSSSVQNTKQSIKKELYKFSNALEAIQAIEHICTDVDQFSDEDQNCLKLKIYEKVSEAELLELINLVDENNIEEAIKIAHLRSSQELYLKLADKLKGLGFDDIAAALYISAEGARIVAETAGYETVISEFNSLLRTSYTDAVYMSINQQLIVDALKVIGKHEMRVLLSNFYSSPQLIYKLAEAFVLCDENELAILLYEKIIDSCSDDLDKESIRDVQYKLAELLLTLPDLEINSGIRQSFYAHAVNVSFDKIEILSDYLDKEIKSGRVTNLIEDVLKVSSMNRDLLYFAGCALSSNAFLPLAYCFFKRVDYSQGEFYVEAQLEMSKLKIDVSSFKKEVEAAVRHCINSDPEFLSETINQNKSVLLQKPPKFDKQSLLKENKRLQAENEKLREENQQLKLKLLEGRSNNNLSNNSMWSKKTHEGDGCDSKTPSFSSC